MKKIEQCRKKICVDSEIGVTRLYKEMKDGGHFELRRLHEELDKEVAKSYNFPIRDIKSHNKILDFLILLNNKNYKKAS